MTASKTPAARVDRVMEKVKGVFSLYGIGQWEKDFLHNVHELLTLSPKQEAKLQEIEDQVFNEGEDREYYDDEGDY
jgi:hypothetical protein